MYAALERAAFVAVSCPVMIEAAAPDQQRLETAARQLHSYDMVICSSARSVRALVAARGSKWPSGPRVAAVGSVTATALVEAGAVDPLVAETFTARALWEKLQFALDGQPDPWFEAARASVDLRQFEPVVAAPAASAAAAQPA